MTHPTESLIQKLSDELWRFSPLKQRIKYKIASEKLLDIIHQHEAEHAQDLNASDERVQNDVKIEDNAAMGAVAPDGVLSREEDRKKPCPAPAIKGDASHRKAEAPLKMPNVVPTSPASYPEQLTVTSVSVYNDGRSPISCVEQASGHPETDWRCNKCGAVEWDRTDSDCRRCRSGISYSEGGWIIPKGAMSRLAQDTFSKMVDVISKGGSVRVFARCDGRDYVWQCDALKYAKAIEPRSEICVIDQALANAAQILANFKACEAHDDGTLERKLEEWQACYAKLFTQMNEIVNMPKPVLVDLEAGAEAFFKSVYGPKHDYRFSEHKALYLNHAKQCAEAWGLKWK